MQRILKHVRSRLTPLLLFILITFPKVVFAVKKDADGTQEPITLKNPLGAADLSIQELVGRGIRIFTGVSGSVALLMFVYGGVMWLTSGGNPEKVQKGKKTFVWATIGLVIIFGSYALVNAVFSALGTTAK